MASQEARGFAGEFAVLLFMFFSCGAVRAQATATVTYVYTGPQGTPLAGAYSHGNITTTLDDTTYGTTALGTSPKGPASTGHVNDPETNLVYMQGRYFGPATGQFVIVDPKKAKAGDSFSVSRYAYVHDNPINNIDPDGRDCQSSNGATTCFTAGYRVSFAAKPTSADGCGAGLTNVCSK